MKKLLITILAIIPAYMMLGQTGEKGSGVDPYYDDPEDILLERTFNGMAGPRSISLEEVSASYTNNNLIINVENYSGLLYIEIKNHGASVFYDIRNIIFNGEIVIPIDYLPSGVYQLVIETGSIYMGAFIL